MALPAGSEEKAAARRPKRQGNTKAGCLSAAPLLIRDDGMLMPNFPLIAAQPNFRPYTGDPKASLQERLDWLKGIGKKRQVLYNPPPDEPFDLNQADADSLLDFAMSEYGIALDPAKPLDKLRAEVYRLSQTGSPGNQMTGVSSEAPGQQTSGFNEDEDEPPPATGLQAAESRTQAQVNAGAHETAGRGNSAGSRRRRSNQAA